MAIIEDTQNEEEILKALSLNSKQREAVLINDVPLLILAGAGSGKTRTIISKIVYDIEVLGVSPYNILAVTFTNKAAEEMRARLNLYLGEEKANGVTIRTFHSFGALILRRYSEQAKLDNAFSIYDENDATSLLHITCKDETIKSLKPYVSGIFEAKERGYNVSNYMKYFNSSLDTYEYFKKYDKALRDTGCVDLPELISLTTSLLSSNLTVREEVQRRYLRVFVDEYQDTNASQFALLKCLVGDENIICVVGDDDQSIYGFRGSEVEHILHFKEYFKGAKEVKLEQNYRSTSYIIKLASSLISNNKQRHDKTLWTANESGKKPELYLLKNEREEAHFVATTIKKDKDYSSTAILYRTNAQSKAFEDEFLKDNIPYYVLRGNSFYERADIKDAVALMSFMINPYDSVAFLRLMQRPKRGVGEKVQTEILDYADSCTNGNVKEAIEQVKLSAKARSEMDGLLNCIESSLEFLDSGKNSQALETLIKGSGLYNYYLIEDEKNADITDTHKSNLDALITQMGEYDEGRKGIVDLLERMALVSAADTKNTNGVALSSVHGVKGLEFNRVFVTGLEKSLFPSSMADDEEEERRLLYVALTRAKRELYLTTCEERARFGGYREHLGLSPFIKELDKDSYTTYKLKSEYNSYNTYNNYNNYYGYNHYHKDYSNSSYSSQNTTQNVPDYLKTTSKSQEGLDKDLVLSRLKRASELENKGIIKKGETIDESTLSALPFKVGDRVKKDDIGEGVVTRIRSLKGRFVMDIKFSNGRESVYPVTSLLIKHS